MVFFAFAMRSNQEHIKRNIRSRFILRSKNNQSFFSGYNFEYKVFVIFK